MIYHCLLGYGNISAQVYPRFADELWSDPQFSAQLKERLERNPVVLRLRESEEPDWKTIAREAQAEAKVFAKQVVELNKKPMEYRIEKASFRGVSPKIKSLLFDRER